MTWPFLRVWVIVFVTWDELGVEPVLLHIERGKLRGVGHLFQMPPLGGITISLVEGPREDPGHARGTACLGRPGVPSGSQVDPPLDEMDEEE